MLEPRGLSRNDQIRPDGVTLIPWSKGKCVVWDYTCRDTLCSSHVSQTSQEASRAAVKAEQIKLKHYQELGATFTVVPIAMETMGSWGPDSLKFVSEIGQRIASHTGEKRSASYLFQAISVAVQRGNVASVRGSLPNEKTLNEIYYL